MLQDSLWKSLSGFLILILLSPSDLRGQTRYFVDNRQGSDMNSGVSPKNAWKTIARVNKHSFRPGDHILFIRDGIWREQLNVPSSGTARKRITFGTYGKGANPVLSGSSLLSSGWNDCGKNVWKHVFKPTTPGSQDGGILSNVFFDGDRGTEVGAVTLVNGPNKWYHDQWKTLYVYSTGNPSTAFTEPGIEASDRYAIVPNGKSYITIDGIDATKGNSGGIWNSNYGNHFEVKNDTISYNGASGFYSDGNYTVFSNAVTRHNGRGRHDHGFYFQADSVLAEYITAYDNAGSGLSYNECSGTIRYCISHDNGSFRNYRNKQKGCGADLTAISTQVINFYYNLLYDNYGVGLWANWGDGRLNIYNNVIAGTRNYGDATGLVGVGAGAGTVIVKNNIFYSQDPGAKDVYIVATAQGTQTFDHNCYFGTNEISIYWKNAGYTTGQFSSFKSEEGQEAHGLIADPMFVDPGKHDFHLQAQSPVVHAGVSFGCTVDLDGTPVPILGRVSIGSFQYTASQVGSPRIQQ